ncbi:hypothetical protein MPL3356_340016 [Mesorhizobium plurifarium]|uniref:Uncharacterized protein n=1 Tax=Mesorhizobium plurifarium TaxID=69974 RepID=A0A090E139_MESPL|nr:hypothetical protein MPL3356_340016 [Mesorhizobium plurifarium]
MRCPAIGAGGRSTMRKDEKRASDITSREIAYEHTHITYVTRRPMQELPRASFVKCMREITEATPEPRPNA